jgi:hypothetical protein
MRRSQKSTITCSSCVLVHLAVGVAMRASGTSSRSRAAAFSIVPPVVDVEHLPSRSQLAADRGGDLGVVVGPTKVSTGWRSSGGVCDHDISRMPVTAISSVRGMGVADIESTSTLCAALLQRLLVLDAEALLLVDDHQAEILERTSWEQPVGADHDVDRAVGQARR